MKSRANPQFRLYCNVSGMIIDDGIGRGQPEAASLLLGGKIRVEYL